MLTLYVLSVNTNWTALYWLADRVLVYTYTTPYHQHNNITQPSFRGMYLGKLGHQLQPFRRLTSLSQFRQSSFPRNHPYVRVSSTSSESHERKEGLVERWLGPNAGVARPGGGTNRCFLELDIWLILKRLFGRERIDYSNMCRNMDWSPQVGLLKQSKYIFYIRMRVVYVFSL